MMADRSENEMAYVAICECGGLVMATVDLPEYRKDVAKEVASCIKKGYEIGRMTVKKVKAAKWCKCKSTANQLPMED